MGPLPTMFKFGGLTFKAVVVALVLIVAHPIELAQAQFMNGATLASCVSLTESGFTSQPAGTNPFNVTFSQSFYRPGDVIQVTFDSATVQTFTGFICQARYANGDTNPVGSFINQNINDYQTLSCSSTDDTITNTGSTPKTLPVTFTWKAPQTDSTQEVLFVTSVVLPNGQFYEHFQSLPLAVSTGFCSVNPYFCQNGVCNDGLNGAVCSCADGFAGERCAQELILVSSLPSGIFTSPNFGTPNVEGPNVGYIFQGSRTSLNLAVLTIVISPGDEVQFGSGSVVGVGTIDTFNGVISVNNLPQARRLFQITSSSCWVTFNTNMDGISGIGFAFQFTVGSNTPPRIGSCPTDFTAIPNGNQFFVQFTPPSCADSTGDAVTVTCNPGAGSTVANFPGVINCTCTDSSQATDSVACIVNQPPAVQCPADFSVTAPLLYTSATAQFNTPQCADSQQANFLATCTPSSGSLFNASSNTVSCTCQDSGGLTDICTFTISVVIPNSLQIGSCPTDFTTVPSGNQFFVQFTTPSCTDPNGDAVTVTCNPGAGSTVANFPGVITCICTDSSQATDSIACPVAVTNIAPVATCPADVTVFSVQGDFGAFVEYNAVCSDSEDPAGRIIASCDPQSGSFFQGLGITVINCTCTVSAGDSNSCVFNVNVMPFVRSPSELNLLIILVPIILLSVLCLVVLAICLSCRRKRKRVKQQNIQLQPLPKPSVSEIQTDDDYETADVGNGIKRQNIQLQPLPNPSVSEIQTDDDYETATSEMVASKEYR